MRQLIVGACFLAIGALGCQSGEKEIKLQSVDQTMRVLHPGTNAELYTTLSTLFDSEKATLDKLLGTLLTAFDDVKKSPVGTPSEIYAANVELERLEAEHVKTLQAILTPVEEAKAALDSAKKAAITFANSVKYYGKKSYCGGDGCDGECNSCAPNQFCYASFCRSTPLCKDKECGKNGVGGVCGVCSDDERCTKEGACVARDSDETAEVCKPECRANPRGTYTKITKQAKNPDFPGNVRADRYANGAQTLGDLQKLTDAVAARIADNKVLLQEKIANDAKVSELTAGLNTLKEQVAANKETIKRLKGEQKAAKKAVKAAAADPAATAAAQAALEATTASLEAAAAQTKTIKTATKETKTQLKAAIKAQKATNKKVKVVIEVQPELIDLLGKYNQITVKWKAAEDAVSKAEAALLAAAETAEKKTKAAEAIYGTSKAAAQQKLDALTAAAIAEENYPVTHEINELTHGIERPAYIIPESFSEEITKVKTKSTAELASLVSKLDAMKDDANEEKETGPTKDEVEGWVAGLTLQLSLIEDIELLVPALTASNERATTLKTNLQDLVQKVRIEAGL